MTPISKAPYVIVRDGLGEVPGVLRARACTIFSLRRADTNLQASAIVDQGGARRPVDTALAAQRLLKLVGRPVRP